MSILILKHVEFMFFVFIEILGGDGSPYEGGIFKLEIQIPERYIFFFQIEMGENISVLNEHKV